MQRVDLGAGSQPRFDHPPFSPPANHGRLLEPRWVDVPSQGCTDTSAFVDLPGFSLLTRMFWSEYVRPGRSMLLMLTC